MSTTNLYTSNVTFTPSIRKRFGATTVVALARAPASDPIDSRWISIVAGLISPAADVEFLPARICARRGMSIELRIPTKSATYSNLKPATVPI